LQFGAAWAHADYTIQTSEKKFVKKVANIIGPFMHDIAMHNSIEGALTWANQKGLDITPAVNAINELMESTDDIFKQGKLSGIFTKAGQTRYQPRK